jgi:hypothetical protein
MEQVEKFNQIIDEVYKRFLNEPIKIEPTEVKERAITQLLNSKESKEEFINKCKTDSEFSEKWGLKIEERELTTVEERKKYDNYFDDLIGEYLEHHETLDKRGVPRKITTLIYQNETVINYE